MFERMKKITDNPLHLKIGIFAVLVVVIVAGIIVLNFVVPEGLHGAAAAVSRVKNMVSFSVFGRPPHFYYIEGERSGKEFRLTVKDTFVVTYRDEFVFKRVSSDAVFGSGKIAVDIEGMGKENDLQVILKGVELVDKVALSKTDVPYQIVVRYGRDVIAAIPVKAEITAQDWLRYARATENVKLRMEYLKRAIALNQADVNVRKMLASLYERSGMKEEAAAQYREIMALKPGDKAAAGEQSRDVTGGAFSDSRGTSAGLFPAGAAGAAEAQVNKALAYAKSKDWPNAVVAYQEALKVAPENARIRFKLGEVYEKMGKIDEAVREYRLVLSKDPEAEYAMVALADAGLKAGQYDEAIKWYTAIIRKRPRDASAYANMGLAYGGKGHAKEEIENYKKALALNPANAVVLYNLGTAYEKGRNDKEAVLAYRKVLKIKPSDGDAMERLAGLELKNKRFTEAIRLYEKVVGKTRQKGAVYAGLGFAYGELKQYKKSADHYEKAIKSGNKEPQVKANLDDAYQKLGKGKETVSGMDVRSPGGKGKTGADKLIDRYIKEKKYDLAIKEYRQMIKKEPRNAKYYAGLGHVHGLKRELDRQIEAYRKALQYDQQNDGVYSSLGEAYEKKGKIQEALNAYTRAYELNPDSGKAAERIPKLKIKLLQEKYEEE